MQQMHKLKPSGPPNRDREWRLSSRFQEEETHLRLSEPFNHKKSSYHDFSALLPYTMYAHFQSPKLQFIAGLKGKSHNLCGLLFSHNRRYRCLCLVEWSFGVLSSVRACVECMYLEKGVPLWHGIWEASCTVSIRGAIVFYTVRHLHLDLTTPISISPFIIPQLWGFTTALSSVCRWCLQEDS